MREVVPVASRSLVALMVAAAASAAVVAHGLIDVIADYLVSHASYDDVSSHASRGLVMAIAAIVAGALAVHGLRLCCEAATSRTVASSPPPSWRAAPGFVAVTILLAAIAVPLMEVFDSRLGGTTLGGMDDAFGGSVLLGLGTTLTCAAAVGIAVFALARWILSHRDRIIAAIVEIIRFRSQVQQTAAHFADRFGGAPIRPRRLSALRRAERAPPRDALLHVKNFTPRLRGHLCYLYSSRRAALSAATYTRRAARRLLAPH